ncbi:MAG: hypothetical protein JXL97_00040 [Bacteroidales bacterium]|nr:hypothetical protein [Bacteroidales bacterium]
MNFFQELKKKRLQKRIDKVVKSRLNKFHYIEKNKSVGLIIDSTDEKVLKRSKEFFKCLIENGNQVERLFFVNNKVKKNEILPDNTISIHGNKWIKSEIVENFTKTKYDILIILNFKELFEIHYLSAIVNADLKVSPHYKEANYADLTFMLNDFSYPYHFFDAVKKYLIETPKTEQEYA